MQEVAALAIAGIAFLYLVRKLSGWPRRKKPAPDLRRPVMGARLARGLKAAQQRDESRPPPAPENAGDPTPAK